MTVIGKLKKKSQLLSETANIGKEGLTPTVIDHIRRQLSQKKIVKVRFSQHLARSEEKKAFAQSLASAVNARLVRQVGFVVVLARK